MKRLDEWIRRFNQQRDNLLPDGYVLQGSVIKRHLQRATPDGPKAYGPYYLWTRKIDQKTVTRALTAEQAKLIKEAIKRNRLLERHLAQLHTLSEQIIFAITPSVSRRKR